MIFKSVFIIAITVICLGLIGLSPLAHAETFANRAVVEANTDLTGEHTFGEHMEFKAGIDFRNGVAQQFVGLAQNNEGFLALNRLLSQHLHLQQAFNGRAPKMKNVIIVYPFSVVDYDWELANHEWIGVKVSDLIRLRPQRRCAPLL